MNITLKTEVRGNYLKIMEHFDRDLFEALKPPFGEMQIVEFTGSKKGDQQRQIDSQDFQEALCHQSAGELSVCKKKGVPPGCRNRQ